jgi:hypothetical protein
MALFSRKAIADIIANESISPEDKIEQIFSLHGQHLDAGYITKAAAEAAKQSAIEEAQKNFKAPDVKESAEYKALQDDFAAYKTRQEARSSADFATVKPKFFDAVYDRIDRQAGAKPVKDQLAELAKSYEEYFQPQQPDPPAGGAKPGPQFGAQTQGTVPAGDGKGSFADIWGYKRKE